MDTLNDDRGQALVVAVLLIAVAAVAISGLRSTQEAILGSARERRAGEAAVEAATAVIADVYAAELQRRSADAAPALSADVVRAITARQAREQARATADAMSLRNGGKVVGDPVVRCHAGMVDVTLTMAERVYRAGFEAPLCSQR